MTTPTAETPTNASTQLRRLQDALEANPDTIVFLLPDETHRRRLQMAVEKQIKNANAARGTVSALDNVDDPLISDIVRTLENVQRILINSRPADNQLDGTPIGKAMAEGARRASGNGKTKPKATESRAQRASGSGAEAEAFTWAETVPEPRPKPGDVIRAPAGSETEVVEPIGFDADKNAFRVTDSDEWDGFIFWRADEQGEGGEWRILSQALEDSDGVAPAGEVAGDSGVHIDDGNYGENGDELGEHEPSAYADTQAQPDEPAKGGGKRSGGKKAAGTKKRAGGGKKSR
jgi:hypothetical protein